MPSSPSISVSVFRLCTPSGMHFSVAVMDSSPIQGKYAAQDCNSSHPPDTPSSSIRSENAIKSSTSLPEQSFHSIRDTISAWIWELAAIGFAFAVVLATFITLAVGSGKDVPSWPLSLSSLISIYSTVLRALLFFILSEIISQGKWSWLTRSRRLRHLDVFDRASRGAWGSVKLLLVAYKAYVPSAAAVMMVALLAIGPFSQQSIETTTCVQKSQEEALIPIAHKVIHDLQLTNGSGSANGSINVQAEIQPQLIQAVVSGLTRPQSTAETAKLAFSCPTANCTFPHLYNISYSSVGICSRCEDLTSFIEESKTDGPYMYDYTLREPLGKKVKISPTEGALTVHSSASEPSSIFNTTILSLSLRPCAYLPGNKCPSRSQGSHIAQLDPGLSITGATCRLFGCIKRYRGEVVNGQLDESVVETTPLDSRPYFDFSKTNDSSTFVGVTTPCIVSGSGTTLIELSNASQPGFLADNSEPGIGRVEYSWRQFNNQSGIAIVALAPCVYEIDASWIRMLGKAIEKVLSGTCRFNANKKKHAGIVDDEGTLPTQDCHDLWWLGGLAQNDVVTFRIISKRFEDISSSLTNYMRGAGVGWDAKSGLNVEISPQEYARGWAFTSNVCTQFRWQWMLLPIGVTFFTFLLLIISVAQTLWNINTPPAWKSSTLPLLFYGFKNHTEETSSAYWMSHKQMARRADMMAAQYTTDIEDGKQGYGITVTPVT